VVGGDGPTEATDYVMFRRFRIDFNDTESNYYGLNIPNNGARRDHNKDRVYIAMPTSLQTSYNPTYKQVELGAMGLAMVKGVNGASLPPTKNLLAMPLLSHAAPFKRECKAVEQVIEWDISGP